MTSGVSVNSSSYCRPVFKTLYLVILIFSQIRGGGGCCWKSVACLQGVSTKAYYDIFAGAPLAPHARETEHISGTIILRNISLIIRCRPRTVNHGTRSSGPYKVQGAAGRGRASRRVPGSRRYRPGTSRYCSSGARF